MDDELQQRNMIITKVRNIIETGKGERLTTEELEQFEEFGGVAYVVYQHAINDLDNNKEIGGIRNDEREL